MMLLLSSHQARLYEATATALAWLCTVSALAGALGAAVLVGPIGWGLRRARWLVVALALLAMPAGAAHPRQAAGVGVNEGAPSRSGCAWCSPPRRPPRPGVHRGAQPDGDERPAPLEIPSIAPAPAPISYSADDLFAVGAALKAQHQLYEIELEARTQRLHWLIGFLAALITGGAVLGRRYRWLVVLALLVPVPARAVPGLPHGLGVADVVVVIGAVAIALLGVVLVRRSRGRRADDPREDLSPPAPPAPARARTR